MSISNFKGQYQNLMLEKLDSELRKQVERQRGQLLILGDTRDLRKVLVETFGQDPGISDYHYQQALAKGREKAATLQENFRQRNPARFNAIVAGLPRISDIPKSYKLGTQLFIVTSFGYSINAVKAAMLKYFETAGLITKGQKQEASKRLHKGHGVKGAAVSETEIAASAAMMGENQDALLAAFQAYSKEASIPAKIGNRIKELVTMHDQLVKPDGTIKDDYFSVVSFQVGTINTGVDAQEEKALKSAFRNFINEYAPKIFEAQGSSSLKQKMTRVVLEPFEKSKNAKVTSKDKKAQLNTKHRATTSVVKASTSTRAKRGGSIKRVKGITEVSSLPLAMIVEFNKRLPMQVKENMGFPALENRTGRFAESVRVTDITQTQQGYPSVGYTYMKNPYQTFETGFKQGSYDRDPRKLIDKSIREIAVEFAIGRFYTRRV